MCLAALRNLAESESIGAKVVVVECFLYVGLIP